MAYITNPWEDDDQWLPQVNRGPLMAGGPLMAPPPLVTPPFIPSSAPLPAPPPIAPVGPSSGPASLDALAELERRRPISSDPAYQPSKARKVLGNIAGAAAGAAAGFLNAGGRVRTDPNIGATITSGIKDAKYKKAAREFEEKRGALSAQARIDQEREADKRKKAESEARIASEQAQKAASEASQRKADRLEAPRPIDHDPSRDLINPVTGEVIRPGVKKPDAAPMNWQARAIQIRMSDATPEEKERLLGELAADYKRVNPEKPSIKFIEDANGNVTAVTATASEVAGQGGQKKLGKLGKGRTEPVNQAGKNAATRDAADEAALKLISDNGGDHEAAIAAAPNMAVRKAVQDDQRRKKLGTADSGKGKAGDRLKALLGGGAPPAAAAPSEIPPEAVAKLKEGKITTFGNGQKWTLKNGKATKL